MRRKNAETPLTFLRRDVMGFLLVLLRGLLRLLVLLRGLLRLLVLLRERVLLKLLSVLLVCLLLLRGLLLRVLPGKDNVCPARRRLRAMEPLLLLLLLEGIIY